MKIKLDPSVASPQDLQALTRELHDYARWLGTNIIKKQVHARRPAPDQPQLSPAAKAVLHDWCLDHPLTRAGIDQLAVELERSLKSAKVLTITLAAPPTGGITKPLTGWCRDNISPSVLVRYEFNQNLLGGMVVRYGSRIYDWSFRRQILEGRGKFPEVLRHV